MGVLVMALGMLCAAPPSHAQQAVFLVRHAEQVAGLEDPPLSEAGHRRAQALADLLKEAGIRAIFTSKLRRTMQTAHPLARILQVQVTRIPRRDPEALISLREQHREQVVLVVAHSDTLPTLLKALGHPVPIRIERTDYANLFVVISRGVGPPVLLRLRY